MPEATVTLGVDLPIQREALLAACDFVLDDEETAKTRAGLLPDSERWRDEAEREGSAAEALYAQLSAGAKTCELPASLATVTYLTLSDYVRGSEDEDPAARAEWVERASAILPLLVAIPALRAVVPVELA